MEFSKILILTFMSFLISFCLWAYFLYSFSRSKHQKLRLCSDQNCTDFSKYRLIYNPRKKIFEKVFDLDDEDVEVLKR